MNRWKKTPIVCALSDYEVDEAIVNYFTKLVVIILVSRQLFSSQGLLQRALIFIRISRDEKIRNIWGVTVRGQKRISDMITEEATDKDIGGCGGIAGCRDITVDRAMMMFYKFSVSEVDS